MKNILQKLSEHMVLRSIILLIVMFFLNFTLVAQSTVSGTVISEDGDGLPGVTVLVQGTSNGTVTDIDGNYSLSTASDASLVISYIGFETQTVQINGRTRIDVTLAPDVKALDEVVVIGYGTRKKSHNTGAIAQIEGSDVAGIQAARVDDALAGKLPGVLIQNQSGEPGASPKIQIRAASSLSGSLNPLIVVDGYPISGGIGTVNPNDIESLEVLKDAASAAIYGSRGANGVILVTTKKGKSGKVEFSYNAYTSVSNKYVRDAEQLKTAGEWANDLQTDAYDLSEIDPVLLDFRLRAYRDAPDVVSMEDWLFQQGSSQSHDFSIRGGSDDINVFASLGYLDTEGVVLKQAFERYNGRLNIDAKLSEKFKAGLNINGSYSQREQVPHDIRDLLRAYSIHPIYHTQASIDFVRALDAESTALGLNLDRGGPVVTFDDGYRGTGNVPSSIHDLQPGDIAHEWHYGRRRNGIGGSGDAGPAAKLDNAERTVDTYFGNVSSYLQYTIMDGLDIKTVLGADVRDTQTRYYQGTLADARERSNQSDLDVTDLKRSTVLNETTLSYAKVFAEHDISAVAGFEFQNTYFRGFSSTATNVPIGLPLNYNLLDPADVVTSEIDQTRSRRSVFGRINYAYDNRYLASVSLRRDGDSRFGVNNQFATFPAVSLGWNLHNESFYSSETVNLIKLRFSTGSLGTASFLTSYGALSILNTGPTVNGTGFFTPTDVANPDLTWQTNTETNYGVNLGFLGNRFTLGVDYYTSDIEDLLLQQSVSEVLGTPSIALNVGDVRSSGLEIELGAVVMEKGDLTWNVNANLSTVSTEITDLGALDELPRTVYGGPSGRGPQWRNYVGGEIGEIWGLEVAGKVETIYIRDPSESVGISSSEWYVVDQNDDGVIDDDDYVKLGSNTPDFYWGLNSQVSYKNFDFSLQFQGSQGGEVYNIDPLYWQSEFGGRLRSSFDADTDGIADHNGLHYAQTRNAHGAGVQDASYVALRNLTIGYTLMPDMVNKVGLSSARVYVAATNLLYLFGDNYTSFNPEGVETVNQNGATYGGPTTYGYQEGASPIVRSFTFGLNVNF